jgi:hypothetical protein
VWSAMYGARPLADSLAVLAPPPHWFQVSLPYLDTVLTYLILVVASLAFLELTLGKIRSFLKGGNLSGAGNRCGRHRLLYLYWVERQIDSLQ